ncbi:hypothetical protein [Polaromonas sp.]|uniref:hypothetical protein n=1 Tax=Polaromonas sp. TaxID=1869339 RepID=UPI0013B79DB2|nr:hypothetical protein [Polaromonas sp.]NDP63062.1 hypothetical protein [Polaromonas sp.]
MLEPDVGCAVPRAHRQKCQWADTVPQSWSKVLIGMQALQPLAKSGIVKKLIIYFQVIDGESEVASAGVSRALVPGNP